MADFIQQFRSTQMSTLPSTEVSTVVPFVYATRVHDRATLLRRSGLSTVAYAASIDTSVDAQNPAKPAFFGSVYSFYSYSKEKEERVKNVGCGRNTRARVDRGQACHG